MSPQRQEPQFGYREDDRGDDRLGSRPPRQPRRERRRSSFWTVLLTGCIVISFAGFLWIIYIRHPHLAPGQIPVITADQTPVKVKPDEPGGMDIPFQNTTVYDELARGKQKAPQPAVEHLLEPSEEPMPKPETPAPSPAANTPATPPPAVAEAQPLPEKSDDSTSPPPAQAEPAKTDDTASAPDALAPPPAAPDAAAPTPAPVASNTNLLPPPPPEKPPMPAVKATASVPVPSTPSTPPVTASIPSPVQGAGYAVQLGAFKDAATANSEWVRLQAAHSDQLGSLKPIVETADLGAKGIWYRLKGGPLGQAQAKQICDSLKAANVACIVAGK